MEEFWQLIDLARADAAGQGGELVALEVGRALVPRLEKLAPERIIEFGSRRVEAIAQLRRWDVCAAAYLIFGEMSHAVFDDFRNGVIALGRDVFDSVHQDPDSLARHPLLQDVAADRVELSAVSGGLLEVAAPMAFENTTGDDEAYWGGVGAQESKASADQHRWARNGCVGAKQDFDRALRALPNLSAMFPVLVGPDLDDPYSAMYEVLE